MQETAGLVSIIVPAYNAAAFLQETIDSVKAQTYTNWEMILVNDGSTDTTGEIIRNQKDARISFIDKKNGGVSAARNTGIPLATGEYIVFLDADDLLTPYFLQTRIEYLDQNPLTGFVGGIVKSFPKETATRKAVGDDPEKEIFFFDPGYVTVPSTYMVRRKTLSDYQITFNTRLNSTADRFFLLQLAQFTKGKSLENETGYLQYRISESSMSHRITPGLIKDNALFYKEIVRNGLLPGERKSEFKTLFFFSLALGFAKVRYIGNFFFYICRAFISNPIFFFSLIRKRIFRSNYNLKKNHVKKNPDI